MVQRRFFKKIILPLIKEAFALAKLIPWSRWQEQRLHFQCDEVDQSLATVSASERAATEENLTIQ